MVGPSRGEGASPAQPRLKCVSQGPRWAGEHVGCGGLLGVVLAQEGLEKLSPSLPLSP